MSPPGSPFSKRQGYKSQPKEIKIREDAPENLRSHMLETARELGMQPSVMRTVVCRVLHELPNTNNWSEFPNIWEEVQGLVYGSEWFRVYDIIEAFYAAFLKNEGEARGFTGEDYGQRESTDFADSINLFFINKGIGWQLVSGEIVTRGTEAYEGTVKTAVTVLKEDEKPTAAGHLQFAVSALSARPKANTSGAVSQATSAVECVLGEITGQAMTLGKYLDKYPDLFHPALKKGLDGIYGYASDEGARHGKEDTEPAREEAEFVVAACAAVCTLLTRKHPRS